MKMTNKRFKRNRRLDLSKLKWENLKLKNWF